MKNFIDKHLNRFVSKKLFVFAIATVFFTLGMLPAPLWFQLTMVYIGSQAAVDIVQKLRAK